MAHLPRPGRLPLAARGLLVAVVLLVLCAAPALADGPASPWTAHALEAVPPGSVVAGPAIATDPHGDAVAVWTRGADGLTGEVRVATFTPGQGWGAAATLAAGAPGSGVVAAMDAAGDVTLAWTADGTVHVADRAYGATAWSQRTLATTPASGLALHANAAGDALLTWAAGSGPTYAVAATRKDGQWSPAQTFGPGLFADGDVDAAGNMLAAWTTFGGPGNCTGGITASRFDAGTRSWGDVRVLESQAARWYYTPKVAFGPAGDATLVTYGGSCGSGSGGYDAYSFHRTAGADGTWGTEHTIEHGADTPRVAALADGFTTTFQAGGALRAADTGSDGTFAAGYALAGTTAGGFALAPDAAGGALAVYDAGGVLARLHGPTSAGAGGGFGASETITAQAGSDLSAAAGAGGRAIAAFRTVEADGTVTLRAAVRDAPGADQHVPVCHDVHVRTANAGAVVVPLTCTDGDGDPLTIAIADAPEHGALGAIDPVRHVVTYTPAGAFAGTDGFGFRATDGHGDAQTARATIDVDDPPISWPGAGAGGPGDGAGADGAPGSGPPVTSGAPQADCPTQVTAQLVRLQGCFVGVDASLDEGGGLVLRGKQEAVAHGKVTMNGLLITPKSAATKIKVFPQLIQTDGDVVITAGSITVFTGTLNMTLTDATGTQESPGLPWGVPDKSYVYGLKLNGSMTPTFTRAGETHLKGPIELPFGANLVAESDVELVTTRDSGLQESTIRAHRENIELGVVLVKHLAVSYDPVQDIWKGSAKVELPTPNALSVGAGLAFQHGRFKAAYGEVDNLNFQITPGIYLQRIKLLVGVDPLVLGGGLGISGGPLIDGKTAVRVDGDFSYTFSAPGRLRVDGTLTLADFKAAHAFFEYLTSGSVRFGGELHIGLPDTDPDKRDKQPVRIDAYLDGFIDKEAFNVEAGADVVVAEQPFRADLLASSKGMAGCGQLAFLRAGFGYTWATHELTVMGPFACDVGDWRVFTNTAFGDDFDFGAPEDKPVDDKDKASTTAPAAGAARAHAAGVVPPAGLALGNDPVVLRLRGNGGAPVVTLHGPGGRTLTVPADGKPRVDDDYVVLSDTADDITYIAIHRPQGGHWTMTRQPGTPTLRDVAGAPVLAAPNVTATVSGAGRSRTLRYRVTPRAGQTVTFAEIGPQTHRVLGRARGARGALRFTPGDGRGGVRKVVAMVEQHGMPRAHITVARYTAPAPAPVPSARGLALTGKGRTIMARWRPSSRVRRWFVTTHLTSGATHWDVVAGRRGRLAVADDVTAERASVTVVAELRDGRRGRATTVRWHRAR